MIPCITISIEGSSICYEIPRLLTSDILLGSTGIGFPVTGSFARLKSNAHKSVVTTNACKWEQSVVGYC